ncbi:MAG: molybdopterin oxidoreductase, partial [Bacteroidetes bacterium]
QNRFDHYSICEESHHIAFSEMTHHKTHHMKPDLLNCKFVIFWGTGAFTANFGLTPMAEKVTTSKVTGHMKTAVVDPRLSNDAAKADFWMPIRPGTDGALAMAMIRWILENERFDARYLRNANKAAAKEDGEPTWTNATHLVKIVDGQPRKFLRANEVGLGSEEAHVVSKNGKLVAVDYHDEKNPVEGDLFVDTTVNGVPVKSSFQILMEEAYSRTLQEYSEITEIPVKVIQDVAREFTSHGKHAAIDFYRGACQHTDGYYASTAIITLNLLIGNPDWKGGLSVGGSHWHEFGGKPGNVYNTIKKPPKGFKSFGVKITREDSGEYETTTLFERDGYPAKRPWYPLATGVYQEVLPSARAGYPYKAKIMLLHKGTPLLSVPGSGYTDIETIKNPDILPLFIASDIVIGETSMYADYILPDTVYLERWGLPHATPDVNSMTSKVRQPVAAPLVESVTVDGVEMPLCLETFIIAIGKKLNLPGVGKDAFGPGLDFDCQEDFYLKAVANIAYGDKEGDAVPDASDEELELFRKARRHLPKSVFDEERWKKAVKDVNWRKVVYVLNRGGRFASFDSGYDGPYLKKKIGSMFYLFNEGMANRKNAMSGKNFYGYPVYVGQYDSMGNALQVDDQNYPLRIITYKEPFGGHSRTISNYWGNIGLQPENKIWINTRDAKKLGLKQNQLVRVVSPSNKEGKIDLLNGDEVQLVGRVLIKEGIKPGVIAISWHYGHWAYGSNDVEVDGKIIKGDPRRKAGICPNPLFQRDPVLKDVVLSCPIGASTSYFDSVANLLPVEEAVLS